MRNVTEGRIFLRRLINEGRVTIKEGVKDLGGLLGRVISLIKPGQDAVEEIDQIIPELGVSTNEQMDQSEAAVQGLFSSFSVEAQRDLNAIEEGVVAVVRMNARSREEGRQEGVAEGIAQGRAQLAAELKSGKIRIEEL